MPKLPAARRCKFLKIFDQKYNIIKDTEALELGRMLFLYYQRSGVLVDLTTF